ncbi:MAG: tripartite tricarboxylate transporter substrate binding protein [Burkholderiales bacterium]|nr:tripartite tricarboxylate transporter substrate binding protein [Burkholderiales bacterium]
MAIGLCVAFAAMPAHAEYPERIVKLVVPYPPGSGTDTIARYMARRLESTLGQPFIVENKPGGNAVIAAQFVARAPADGYTLLWAANGPVTTNVALYNKLPYDPVKEFAPVARVAYSPMGLYVAANSPYTSVASLVEAMKKQPGHLNYGMGSATYQMATEWLLSLMGVKANGVSYKGAAPALTDLAGGQTDFVIAEYSAAAPLVKGGRLRLLAVTSDKRMPADPDIPTLQELGYKDFFQVAWWGVFAPANTPAPVLSRLEETILQIMGDAETAAYLNKNNYSAFVGKAGELRRFQESEIRREKQLVEQFNVPKLKL